MARRPFRRQRRHPLVWLLSAIVLLAGAWLAGFLVFLTMVWAAVPPDPIPHADGIVALTGGNDRVGAALALLAEGVAPALLISGAGRGTHLGDFTEDNAATAARYAGAITIGHQATTTRGNAEETAVWATAHHMHALLVVTADYHMPRAILELRHFLPQVMLYPVPVRPPALSHPFSLPTLRLLALEYTKYLAVRSGLFDRAAAEFTDAA